LQTFEIEPRLAIGILAIRVDEPANQKDALSPALAHRGPAVVDVMTSPQELAMMTITLIVMSSLSRRR
jgi:thiamine pyrophosphate-dependent acetolactate synthase large subunit-like protein